MGQPVTVVQKTSSSPGILRFEINRSITGMGHERFSSLDDIVDDRPVDELARRLLAFEGCKVERIHVNSNVITLEVAGTGTAGLHKVIEDLFLYYRPGVRVPTEADFA